jgi:predicted KAP-like P-loop ATPase
MNKALTNIPKILNLLNKKTKLKLINYKHEVEIPKQCKNLKQNINKLQEIFKKTQNIATPENYSKITIDLYGNTLDIMQNFQDILETVTTACQKYQKKVLEK